MNRIVWSGMALFVCGCFNPGDCLKNNKTNIELAFVNAAGAAQSVQFSSITISGLKAALLTNVSVNAVSLPVNPAATSTTYVFVRGSRKDSITFTYRNQALVLNPDCGAILYHRDLDYALNTFGLETLVITNRQLLTSVSRNATLRF